MKALSGAEVKGDGLGSRELEFQPQGSAKPGRYTFDVAAASVDDANRIKSLCCQPWIKRVISK